MASEFIPYPEPQHDDTVYTFTEEEKAEIQKHVAKYPDPRSAVMPALWIAQEKWGWLPQGVMQLVADTLELPYAHVFGVATFYTMYLKDKRAENLLEVCTCFSCGECNGREVYQHAQQYLQVDEHGVSADGKIYLREAECLGACDTAPVVQINNRRMRFNVDENKVESIIEDLRAGKGFDYEAIPLYDQNVGNA